MNPNAKIFKNISKLNPAIFKRNKTPQPTVFYLRNARLVRYLKKSVNVIHHIDCLQKKKHMNISIEIKKSIWPNSTSKLLSNLRIERSLLYEKPPVRIVLNSKRLGASSLR